MLSNLVILFQLTAAPPSFTPDWFESTSKTFEFCTLAGFEHPICPPIYQKDGVKGRMHKNFVIKAPSGNLTSENLFRAVVLYQLDQPPVAWLVSLKLTEERPARIPKRLWAEAQHLYAKVLFDQRKFKEAEFVMDRSVEGLKTRSLYHQQRAWVHFFNGKWDRALGSLVSAESPLIYPVPFFDKYFLKALVERETCQWGRAFATIARGREVLKTVDPAIEAEKHPWVQICDQADLKAACGKIREFYTAYYAHKLAGAKSDLDLLEIEMRDRGITIQKDLTYAEITWPYEGEDWKDELGYYSVPIKTACG